jgi:hypothetical protein
MFKSTSSFVLGGAIALLATLPAATARADNASYQYVNLDKVPLPAPYVFFSPSVVIDGRVFGTVFDSTFTITNVAVYNSGTITVGPPGEAFTANRGGVMGGEDPNIQAALFNGNTTTLIPRLPGFAFEEVVSLADSNLALVQSTNDAFNGSTFSYFFAGMRSVIDFGLPDPVQSAFMNDQGLIALNKEASATDLLARGYRYDPRTGQSTLLPPFAGDKSEVNVLVQGINVSNQVLGTSSTSFAGKYHEHVGVWNAAGVFQPYVQEKIQASALVFNDFDEIVITSSASCPFCDDTQCFLVPAPGTRLDLGSLVRGVPPGFRITQALSIDNFANIAGVARDTSDNVHPFLLQPISGR